MGKQHPRQLVGPEDLSPGGKKPIKVRKGFFKKMSRHLFGSQEVFFTFHRARCLPLLARVRTMCVRPQELVIRAQEALPQLRHVWVG